MFLTDKRISPLTDVFKLHAEYNAFYSALFSPQRF